MAAGLKNGGSNAAFGLTEMLARWIQDGPPSLDAYELEVARFLPAHNNYKFLRDRVTEVPGKCQVLVTLVNADNKCFPRG